MWVKVIVSGVTHTVEIAATVNSSSSAAVPQFSDFCRVLKRDLAELHISTQRLEQATFVDDSDVMSLRTNFSFFQQLQPKPKTS